MGVLLSQNGGFEVVVEADDGPALVSQAASLHPDVVLMDEDLPTQNEIDAAREIAALLPAARTLLFTWQTLDEVERRRSEAVGVLAKTAGSAQNIEAIRARRARRCRKRCVDSTLRPARL